MTKTVDTVVNDLIGDWGPWQRRSVILIYLCKIPIAWFMACIVFTAPIPKPGEVSCYQPETAWTVPQTIRQNEIISTDFCMRSNRSTYDDASINHLSYGRDEKNDEAVPCTTFQYNTPFETTVTKFNLVCARSILISTSQFSHLLGVLVGGILATKVLERISPRTLMLYGMVIQIFVGCLAGMVSIYEVHMLFRFLAAVCCTQMFTAGQVIFTDITSNKYRTTSICFYDTFWSLAIIALPGIIRIDPNWSSIFLMISLPTILYIPIWFFIPDAPKWYLHKGRIDEAVAIIENAISVNKTKYRWSEPVLRKYIMDHMTFIISQSDCSTKWLSLWTNRRTVVSIVAIHIAWAVYVTNFSGMLFNVKAFGREYLSFNTIALAICEIIGSFIGYFLIMNSKRKWQYAGMFNIFAGCFASIGYFYPSTLTPDQKTGLLMLTAIVPKIAVSCSQSILFACTAELIEPEKRNILLLSCTVWARICLLTAPYIGALLEVHQLLPLSIFGMLGAIGGIATCFISTPRTIEPRECCEKTPSTVCVVPDGKIFTIH